MSVVFVALPVTILIAAAFVVAFVVSVRRGQFDDLDTPAYRMLFDDDAALSRSTDGHGPQGAGGAEEAEPGG